FYDPGPTYEDGGGPGTGAGHGTSCAAIIAGLATNDPGMAPGAKLIIQENYGLVDSNGNRITDATYNDIGTALANATANGAIIHSNSWGGDSDGLYGSASNTIDNYVRSNSITVLFAAGNEYGQQYQDGNCSMEACSKNIISVGAIDDKNTLSLSDDTIATFSNRGTKDGRIKPDIVAGGVNIATATLDTTAPYNANDTAFGGTSAATPIVAGAAAIVQDWYRTKNGEYASPALVKAFLINGAVRVIQQGHIPSPAQGWGEVNVTNIVNNNNLFYADEGGTNVLSNGGSVNYNVQAVAGTDLKITIVWRDYPAPSSTGSGRTLMNDLDLVVLASNGTVYRGNNFSNSYSVPNAAGRDSLNNVECVYIPAAYVDTSAPYTIYINGTSIGYDSVPSVPGVNQDFAIVVSGVASGIGKVFFAGRNPRNYYNASGSITIKVTDVDLNTNPAVQETYLAATIGLVKVWSGKDREPVWINLTEEGANNPVFSGVVVLDETIPYSDNITKKVAVNKNDTLYVNYYDRNPANNLTDLALYDNFDPVISEVQIANIKTLAADVQLLASEYARVEFYLQDQSTLKWTELTTGYYYSPAAYAATQWILDGLTENTTYYLQINATDLAGNSIIDNNGGQYYRFRTLTQDFDLLYVMDDPWNNNYTWHGGWVFGWELDMAGYKWTWWNVSASGAPTAAQMAPYELVVWNTERAYQKNRNLGDSKTDTTDIQITTTDQTNIQNYILGATSSQKRAFCLMGANIAEELDRLSISTFLRNYFAVQYKASTGTYIDAGDTLLVGNGSEPIGKGNLTLDVFFSAYYEIVYQGRKDWNDNLNYISSSNGSVMPSFRYEDYVNGGCDWGAVTTNNYNHDVRTHFFASAFSFIDIVVDGYYTDDLGTSKQMEYQKRIIDYLSFATRITGNVKDEVRASEIVEKKTNAALAGITVIAVNTTHQDIIIAAATTSENGDYYMNMPAYQAENTFKVTALGSAWFEDEVYSGGTFTPVTITKNADTPNINFSLDSGAIWGSVYDENGPVFDLMWNNAVVLIYENKTGKLYDYDFTDTEGRYLVTGLKGGSYDVLIRPVAFADGTVGNYNIGNASAWNISVTWLQDTYPVDLYVGNLKGSIEGTVYRKGTTTPIPNMIVYAVSEGTDGVYQSGYAVTDINGHYNITGLKGGQRYNITAGGEGYYWIMRPGGNVTVNSGQTTTGVDIYLPKAPRIIFIDDDGITGNSNTNFQKHIWALMNVSGWTSEDYKIWDNDGTNPGESGNDAGGIPNEANQGTFFHDEYAPWPHITDIHYIWWYSGDNFTTTWNPSINPDSPTKARVSTITYRAWTDFLLEHILDYGGMQIYEGGSLGYDLNYTGNSSFGPVGSPAEDADGNIWTDEYFYYTYMFYGEAIDARSTESDGTLAARVGETRLQAGLGTGVSVSSGQYFTKHISLYEPGAPYEAFTAAKTGASATSGPAMVYDLDWALAIGTNCFVNTTDATQRNTLMKNILNVLHINHAPWITNVTVTPMYGSKPSAPVDTGIYNITAIYWDED
ncbi:MAG: S8 family serine peptidase, partial [Thermoplasmata archaeon]